MLLTILTLLAIALFVLVLAGYLTAIAWALTRARRNVIRLADVFERIADETAALDRRIDQADHEVAELAAAMRRASGTMTDAATRSDRNVSA